MNFEIIDYIIWFLILFISILIGLLQGSGIRIKLKELFKVNQVTSKDVLSDTEMTELKQKEDNSDKTLVKEYLNANASMSVFPIAFSLLASFYSATGILGFPAEIYQYGIEYIATIFGCMLTPLIGAFITGPFFYSLKVMSVFEYLEIRFESKKVRKTGMFCYVIRSFISSAIYMYGPATTLSSFTNINENISIILIGFIATIYTTIGGIKAVIWTDFFQALVMFLSLAFILVKGLYDANGFENLWKINAESGRLNFLNFNPDPFIRQSTWSLFFGAFCLYSYSYCFDQQMIQRFQAAKSKKKAQLALILNIPGVFFITTLCSATGLILYSVYFTCDPLSTGSVKNPNQLISYYVINNFSALPGVSGLFLGALFCAALSSVSSTLNSQSAILWNDFFKSFQYFASFDDKKSLRANKIIVLICGLVCTCLSFLISTIGGNLTQISASINGALIGPIVGLFLLGLLFSNTNKYGVITGVIIGFLSGCFLLIGFTYINILFLFNFLYFFI